MSLLTKYQDTRARSEAICTPLETEDYVPQLVEFASPPKWHLAHTTWFFETMILQKFVSSYQIYHPDFSFLFNSYYESVGKRTIRSQRGHITRPTVKEVYAYRKHVNEAMSALLNEVLTEEIKHLLVLGINHEQQHQELLWTDLKFMLGHNPIFPVYEASYDDLKSNNQSQDFVKVSAGNYEVGFEGEDFHFDNEKERYTVYLRDYEIANFLVTNKEYLNFIADGGYQKFQYWLDEGWAWVQQNEITAPLYWIKKNNEWYQYALSGLQKVNPENILTHVSFYEAQAFANWKGMRLPTEAEWEVASMQLNWGQRWEWTNSAYLPYPKYKAAEGAVGEYNGKFMINQMVLRGASIATAKGHERNTYRNFFAPYHQWQYTGIRLVK